MLLVLLPLLVLVSVLALLGVLTLLRTWDLLRGWLEGAVFVLVDLVDLELLGLMTELGVVDGLGATEEVLGIADLVTFKEAGDMGAVAGLEDPVDAADLLGFEDLFGEGMMGTKGLVVLEVMVDMQDLVAMDSDLIACHGPTV